MAIRTPAAARPAASGRGATPAAGVAISLDKRGGDAWAWRKRLSGTCVGCPPGTAITLRVGDQTVAAERTGDVFAADVPFAPGENEVVAVATRPDGSEVSSAPVIYRARLDPRPTARLVARVEGEGNRVVFDATGSSPSEYDGAPVHAWRVAPRAGDPAALDLAEEAAGVWSGAVPGVDGEYVVGVTVADERGRTDAAAAAVVVEGGRARVSDPVGERAAWIADAVVYGVVPRNFEPPGFAGVAARLDDLADLGVTALWFAPITRTPAGLFGYEVTDYFDVRPEYGTKEEFRALVDAAHARGLRVLMDFVPNHSSAEHPYARDAAVHGPASTYWDFYDRDAGGTPNHYFDWSHLPNLNYDNPEVRRFVLEAFAFWVRECRVDGFRVDAVWGIKERQPDWLDVFLAEMNRIKPDSLLIAEASARDPFYAERGFDAAYDWTAELGRWAWADALGGVAPVGGAMVEALTDGGRGYHPAALVMRFLNNNDTGARFVTTYGVDFYRVALAMLLTLPGLPCLYTGDEVGAEFEPYATTGPIDWGDRFGLRPSVKELIALRRATPALHAPDWQPLAVEPAAPLFAFLRFAAAEPETAPVAVLLNFSAAEVVATVPETPEVERLLERGDPIDLLTGEVLPSPGGGTLSAPLAVPLPAWGVRVVAGHGA